MYIHSLDIGYIDIPNHITLNIFTVGCEHHCKGCHTPDLQNFNHPDRKEVTAIEINNKLGHDFYDGICWLGRRSTLSI